MPLYGVTIFNSLVWTNFISSQNTLWGRAQHFHLPSGHLSSPPLLSVKREVWVLKITPLILPLKSLSFFRLQLQHDICGIVTKIWADYKRLIRIHSVQLFSASPLPWPPPNSPEEPHLPLWCSHLLQQASSAALQSKDLSLLTSIIPDKIHVGKPVLWNHYY